MKSFRKATSLTLGISFLIMSYTGIILFIVPKGKVAYWVDWHLFGLSKEQYGELHTTSMVVMLIFSGLHIYYNWSAIINYMKNKTKKISFSGKDFLIAISINIFFIVATLFMLPPVYSIIKMENKIKDNWTMKYGEPPYGHAEESSLKVFTKKVGLNFDEAVEKLKNKGIKFKDSDRLKDIAKRNNITPNDIYLAIDTRTEISLNQNITNLGRKTLKNLSDMKKIDLQKSLIYIKQKGFEKVNKDSKMKEIADNLNITPFELYEKLTLK